MPRRSEVGTVHGSNAAGGLRLRPPLRVRCRSSQADEPYVEAPARLLAVEIDLTARALARRAVEIVHEAAAFRLGGRGHRLGLEKKGPFGPGQAAATSSSSPP